MGAEPVNGGYSIYLSTGHAILIRPLTEDALTEALTQAGYLDPPEEDAVAPLSTCFTEAELKSLADAYRNDYHWIAKDANGKVFAYEREPRKGDRSWLNDDSVSDVIPLKAGEYAALSFKDIAPLHIGTIMEALGL